MNSEASIERDFEREWLSFHFHRRPLSWMLRSDKSLAWVRFHSLPNSKRYPEDEAEERIVLNRAYTLANATLGTDAGCWQIECRAKEPSPSYWDLLISGTAATTFADEDGKLWCVNVLKVGGKALLIPFF
ncbi:DUF3885 domain-containing protein [Rhizobium sp. LEGMi135b]